MLLELNITNFALIKNSIIRFKKGLNILSGETGAGKSIIFEALSVCLGERASKNMIKSGEDHAIIEATFMVTEAVKETLKELGLYNDEEVFTIRRDIFMEYPSISRINGFSVTINNLKTILSLVCDIYGQYEHQLLLNQENYLPLIDKFCSDTSNLLEKVELKFKEVNQINLDLTKLKKQSENLNSEIDYIEFQINEINSLNLKPGEDDDLKKRLHQLENFQTIYNSIINSKNYLNGDIDNLSGGVINNLNQAISSLSQVLDYDSSLRELNSRLESSLYEIEDVSNNLDKYLDIEFDESELEEINFRLSSIQSIKKKYNKSIDEIISYVDVLENELNDLKNIESNINKKESELNKAMDEYNALANNLSMQRKSSSKLFEDKLKNELKGLDMQNIDFKVDFQSKLPSSNGTDIVDFMAITNKGSLFRPIRDIISGGEMSRFMLAIKKVFADDDLLKTLVFDEIDAGLSGKVANSVGNRLLELSNTRQVILISHLPQIISKADVHFKIIKFDDNNETISSIRELNREQRIEELARLLSGDKISESTLKNAEELLNEREV